LWNFARGICGQQRKDGTHESEWSTARMTVMADNDRPFVIERAGPKGRIRLNAAAKYWAQEHGMSLAEMAQYLLMQNQGVESSAEETPAAEEKYPEDILPDVTLSENIEDRRQEPEFVADSTMNQVWGGMPAVSPQAQQFGSNPLASALGFSNVGRSPSQAPSFYGPNAPPSFLQFLQNQRGY